jgi:hypothetical protein
VGFRGVNNVSISLNNWLVCAFGTQILVGEIVKSLYKKNLIYGTTCHKKKTQPNVQSARDTCRRENQSERRDEREGYDRARMAQFFPFSRFEYFKQNILLGVDAR